jgi:flavin-dependent dehydrogenase
MNHRRSSVADAVIVGAGPAGAAAATTLANAGLRAILLDGRPDAQTQPGETLHPGAETLFRALGVDGDVGAACHVRHGGHWVRWFSPIKFEAFGSDHGGGWRGFQLRRPDLKAILLARAQRLAVDLRRNCWALAPVFNAGRVTGVQTRDGPIAARYVIDASGGSHWLARAGNVHIRRVSPRLIARFGWAASSAARNFSEPVLTGNSGGWTWIAQVHEDLCAWTRLDLASGPSRPRHGVPKRLQRFEQGGPPRGADVTWRCVSEQAGAGYFRVGDAGAVLDPISSHGVLRALLTGITAAYHIFRVSRSGAAEHDEIVRFNGWANDWFLRDVARLKQMYLPAGINWPP